MWKVWPYGWVGFRCISWWRAGGWPLWAAAGRVLEELCAQQADALLPYCVEGANIRGVPGSGITLPQEVCSQMVVALQRHASSYDGSRNEVQASLEALHYELMARSVRLWRGYAAARHP